MSSGLLRPRASALGPLAIAAVLGCGRVESTAPRNDYSGRYGFLREFMVTSDRLEKVRSQLPYTRIELSESSPWMGGRTISLDRDGSISVDARSSGPGSVSIFDYGSLCYLIERIGFESMQPRYAWKGFDATTWTVKIWRSRQDQRIQVEDYGLVGPPDLWVLRTAIEGVAARALWK